MHYRGGVLSWKVGIANSKAIRQAMATLETRWDLTRSGISLCGHRQYLEGLSPKQQWLYPEVMVGRGEGPALMYFCTIFIIFFTINMPLIYD